METVQLTSALDKLNLLTLCFVIILQVKMMYQMSALYSQIKALRGQVDALTGQMESQVRYFLKKLWDGKFPTM